MIGIWSWLMTSSAPRSPVANPPVIPSTSGFMSCSADLYWELSVPSSASFRTIWRPHTPPFALRLST
jgi:hypothetical protein